MSNILNHAINRFAKSNIIFTEFKQAFIPLCLHNRDKHYQAPYFGSKNHWPQWSMMKDQRKRMTFKEYGRFKLRYNAIRKNDILPPELQEIADYEIASISRDASLNNTVRRCCVTSRPRGTVFRWRLSRIIFKHLADYNKLSGVQRAMW